MYTIAHSIELLYWWGQPGATCNDAIHTTPRRVKVSIYQVASAREGSRSGLTAQVLFDP